MVGGLWFLESSRGDFDGMRETQFPVVGHDAFEYNKLAVNILKHREFSTVVNETLVPESFRTPGYPLFVAIILALFKVPIAVAVIQSILAGITAVMAGSIVYRALNARIAAWAGIVFAVEPITAYYSVLMLSETLFTFLLFSVICILIQDVSYQKRLTRSGIAGALLGLAVLVRPIAAFLIPIIVVGLWIVLKRRETLRRVLSVTLVFIVGYVVVVSPWLIRNNAVFGRPSISSLGAYNLLFYNASMFYAQKYNVSLAEARQFFVSQIPELGADNVYERRSLLYSGEEGTLALRYLKENVFEYGWFHFVRMAPFFITDGIRDVGLQIGLYQGNLPDITGLLLAGKITQLTGDLLNSPAGFTLLIVGAGFWSLVFFLMIIGLIHGFWASSRERLVVIGLFIIIGYFAFMSSPVANGRYRLPVVPFMIALAGFGWGAIRKIKRSHPAAIHSEEKSPNHSFL